MRKNISGKEVLRKFVGHVFVSDPMAMVEELLAVWLLPKSGTRRRYFDAGDGLWCEGTTRAREVNVRSGGMDRPRYMKNTFVSQLKTVKNRLSIYEMTSCNSDPSLRTTLCDLEWRDGSGSGLRSFSRPQGPSSTGRLHVSPHRQTPPTRHSDPSPPDHCHQVTETVITLLPSHLGASSPARPHRAYFHLRSDDTGERSGSNQSLSDGRATAGGVGGTVELPRLATQRNDSADSNARHSSGVFIFPTDSPHTDSPRFRDRRDLLGGRRGSQWSPSSKDSGDNAKLDPESNVEPTSSRLMQGDHQDQKIVPERGLWQRTGLKSEALPFQGNALRDGYTKEKTFTGVKKVNPLTRMNQILSKSNTNLSKSEFLSTAGRRGNNSSNLQRHYSEINLANRFTGCENHRGFQYLPNPAAQRPAALATQPNRKMLIKSQSQPLFRPGNDRHRPPVNRKSHQVKKNDSKDTPEAEEKTKQERIIEWLLNVDGYAEPPDSPIIFEDGPLQSDTAIHVVYEGD